MTSRKLFDDDDLAALAAIAAVCEDCGLTPRYDDIHVLDARGSNCAVTARIRPARERDGVQVTGLSGEGRRIFDGPSTVFSPRGLMLLQLRDWLQAQARLIR